MPSAKHSWNYRNATCSARTDTARRSLTEIHRRPSSRCSSLKRPNLERRSGDATSTGNSGPKRPTAAPLRNHQNSSKTLRPRPPRRPVGRAGKRTQGAAGSPSQHTARPLRGPASLSRPPPAARRIIPCTVFKASAPSTAQPEAPHRVHQRRGVLPPSRPHVNARPSRTATSRTTTSRQRRVSLRVEAGLLQEEVSLVVQLPDTLLELWGAPLVDQQATLGVQRLLQLGAE